MASVYLCLGNSETDLLHACLFTTPFLDFYCDVSFDFRIIILWCICKIPHVTSLIFPFGLSMSETRVLCRELVVWLLHASLQPLHSSSRELSLLTWHLHRQNLCLTPALLANHSSLLGERM